MHIRIWPGRFLSVSVMVARHAPNLLAETVSYDEGTRGDLAVGAVWHDELDRFLPLGMREAARMMRRLVRDDGLDVARVRAYLGEGWTATERDAIVRYAEGFASLAEVGRWEEINFPVIEHQIYGETITTDRAGNFLALG